MGRPIFIEMLRGRHPVCFVAFDLLWLNGEDLRLLPLVERKARLRRLLRRRGNHLIAEALAIEGRGKALRPSLSGTILRASSQSDPLRRGVKWWKVLNRDHSQAEGRHELFSGESVIPALRGA